MRSDLLIIGGGAAGLSAAYEAAKLGLEVIIAEESPRLGGQFNQQTQFMQPVVSAFEGLRVFEVKEKLIDELKTLPVTVLLEHTLIGTFSDGRIGLSNKKEIVAIETKRVLIATGASEGTLIFPGWTQPGVMPLGAAQIMVNRERVYPGKKAAIIGTSEYALEIARQLFDAGIEIKVILEKASAIQKSRSSYVPFFIQKGIPIYANAEIESVQGNGEVEKIRFRSNDQMYEMDVDLVCFDGGLYPILESFYIFDCSFSFVKKLGGWVPCYDDKLETSKKGIYVAGSAAGVTCNASVILLGMLAGISIAGSLKKSLKISTRIKELWKEIEQVEVMWNPEIWNSRVQHILDSKNKHFLKPQSHWTY